MEFEAFTVWEHALDEAPAVGQVIMIRQILFEGLRAECAQIGVREGQMLRLETETDSHLLLDTLEGQTVALKREYARFIAVTLPHRAASDRASKGGTGTPAMALLRTC